VIDQFANALEGEPAPRLEICRALLNGDTDNFADALAALMQEKQESDDRKRPTLPDTAIAFWPRSYVSVEGLALLKAAELVNLPVGRNFPLCPPEGRLGTQESPSIDFFASLESALAADR